MPFIANTPESLVGRSDSKNPATTCRGITAGGRPCRRPIGAANAGQVSLGGGGRHLGGRLRADDPRDERLYCWQHKEQASLSARSSPGPRTSATPILEERTSLDTLADRLNLLSINTGRRDRGRAKMRPLAVSAQSEWKRPPPAPRPLAKKHVSFCFCFTIPIEQEFAPPARPRPRPVQPLCPSSLPGSVAFSDRTKKTRHSAGSHHGHHPRSQTSTSSGSSHGPRQSFPGHLQSSRRPSTASQTAQFLSLILPTTSPQTASALMAELAKPISQVDEPGYIYMFWLTPESQGAEPPADAARSLLAPPSRPGGSGQRRASDIVASFAAGGKRSADGSAGGQKNTSKNTLLLKIGRANNVQRRLNEWQRQCGYDVSLIRYYPYIPSSASNVHAADAGVPRKMPHSHKVERLIHIELAGLGLRIADSDKCNACGREHREWFQVAATRKAVAEVDEVIRRWSDWNEGRL